LAQRYQGPHEIVLALQAAQINFLHHEIQLEYLLAYDDQSMEALEEGLGMSQNQLNPLPTDPVLQGPIP
jgi:hypothetical protein